MSWTDERIAKLEELWRKGVSASEIADILGDVTRNAVIGKAHRLGLSGRPSPIRVKKTAGASIQDLTDKMCKWPIGDPKHADFHFCGAAAHPGFPYCAKHASIAYQTPQKRREEEEREKERKALAAAG